MKPLRSDKEDGVSNVVSMLLMLTVLVIALSLASATYIPDLKENAEIILDRILKWVHVWAM